MTREEKRTKRRVEAWRERIALTIAVTILVAGIGTAAARSEADPAADAAGEHQEQRLTPATTIGELPGEDPEDASEDPPEETPDTEHGYYDIPLSHDLQDHVFSEAEKYGVPAELVFAMMDQESNYRTNLISSTNDYGIMQINRINHETLREALGVTDIMDPEQNITCGVYMIGAGLDKYDGDMTRALTAYNRGDTGARRYYETYGTYETEYSRGILETYAALVAAGRGGE